MCCGCGGTAAVREGRCGDRVGSIFVGSGFLSLGDVVFHVGVTRPPLMQLQI